MNGQCKITGLIILIGLLSCDRELDKPDRGEVVWSVPNQRENLVGTQPMIEKGKVYFLQDGRLKSFTLENGRPLWSVMLVNRGDGDFSRKIIGSGDRLFIDLGWEVRAYEKANGQLVWETEAAGDPESISGIGAPIMSQDDSNLYIGRAGYVLKMRKSDGQIIMTIPLDSLKPDGIGQGSTEPLISPYGDQMLYIPASYWDAGRPSPEESSGGNIFAYDAQTGEFVWGHHIEVMVPNLYTDIPDDSLTGSPFVYDIDLTEGMVIALAGFYIVALDRWSGQLKWQTYFPEGGFDVGLAVQGDGIYAVSLGGWAYRLDLYSGEVLWRTFIRYSNTGIPTVLNGRMFFSNFDEGAIWVLGAQNGEVIFHRFPPGYQNDDFDIYISSLGVGEGYMVNVGSKSVYCLLVP